MSKYGGRLLEISPDEYRALETGINWHSLERMSVSPAQYIYELHHKSTETKSMSLGKVEHLALLQTDEFLSRYLVTGHNRNTKKFLAEAEEKKDRVLITEQEYEMIMVHIERFQKNEYHGTITKNSYVEQAIQWRDQETGLLCKGIPDMFNQNVLVDIKTSAQTSDKKWWWDFMKYKYHCQFAYYQEGLEELDGCKRICICVKVETAPCYDVVYYPLPWEALEEGRKHYERLRGELRDCMNAQSWPGKDNGGLARVAFDRWALNN